MIFKILFIFVVTALVSVSCQRSSSSSSNFDIGVAKKAPSISIVFITKRPGGYDVLFNMLLQQTVQDFELLIIDDLGQHRRETVLELARRKGIRVHAYIPSKPKDRGTKFGQFNAINTGVLISSGKYIVILQDNIWLPPTFMQRTLEFYSQHQETDLLGYPEQRYDTPKSILIRDRLHDPSTVTVFSPELKQAPSELGWEKIDFYATMTTDVLRAMGKPKEPFTTWWFECAACTVPWRILSELNGLDEVLDKGDDAQEVNIKDRAFLLGYEVWDMPDMVIELIDHHRWENDDEWTRFEGDTNIHRWGSLKDKMAHGKYPFLSPNSYNMSAHRDLFHPQLATQGVPSWGDEVFVSTEWSQHLPPNPTAQDPIIAQWLSDALKDTQVFKPQFLFVYAMSPEEEQKWGDGMALAIYNMRQNFHINPFNVYGWQEPSPGTWNVKVKNVYHFMLGYGPLGGTADRFLSMYDKVDPGPNSPENDGTPTKKGFVISHGGGRGNMEPYKVVFYPTPWHQDKLKSRHPNARHALGVNSFLFTPTPQPLPHHEIPCPPLWESKSFCKTEGLADPEFKREWKEYDVVVVADVVAASRLDKLLEMKGSRLVVGWIDETCEECAEIADKLAEDGVELSNPVTAQERAELFRMAKSVYFPQRPDGGGEMTLMEARACGANIQVEEDNPRLQSLINAPVWDHSYVADQITHGIWSSLHPGKGF